MPLINNCFVAWSFCKMPFINSHFVTLSFFQLVISSNAINQQPFCHLIILSNEIDQRLFCHLVILSNAINQPFSRLVILSNEKDRTTVLSTGHFVKWNWYNNHLVARYLVTSYFVHQAPYSRHFIFLRMRPISQWHITLGWLCNDKHSSLIRTFVRKKMKVLWIGPQVSMLQTYFLCPLHCNKIS